jgi:hypothetical protein
MQVFNDISEGVEFGTRSDLNQLAKQEKEKRDYGFSSSRDDILSTIFDIINFNRKKRAIDNDFAFVPIQSIVMKDGSAWKR